ncbi:MAG: hypothetical protein HWN67_00350 [Candidatus Helarchaeota archaeon]|nr:hypothetical protein [Candidatus Helarchaeota archaeon]
MERPTYADRVTDRYVRRNFINGVFTLFGKKYFVYTLILLISVTISLIANTILPTQNPFMLKNIVIFEISTIFAFIISGILAFRIKSTILRLISILIFNIIFFLLFQIYFYNFWKDVLNSFIIINMGMICISFLIVIRNFNTSWIGRLMVGGKGKRTTAFYSMIRYVGLGIGFSAYLLYLFLTPSPFETSNYNYLFLSIFNGVANLLLMLIVYKKSFYDKYFSHDFFVQALTFFYGFSLIPMILISFLENETIFPLFNFALIIFTILSLTQAITSTRSEYEEKLRRGGLIERIKDARIKRNSHEETVARDIIIINIEEEDETQLDIPNAIKAEKKKQKKIVSAQDGKMIIFLGLCLSFHFLIVQFFINRDILFPIPIMDYPLVNLAFNWQDLNTIISIIAFGIIIVNILLYFGSNKLKEWYSNNIPLQAAFWEFLTLIDRKERMEFLAQSGDIIRETLITGVMDFIDRARDDIESTVREGIDFFRQFFGIGGY